MIVEDNKSLCDLFSDFFLSEGFNVLTAENGVVALNILRSSERDNLPDCILLDILMPVMDGDQFLQEVNSDKILSAIPVIICSGSDKFTHTPQIFAALLKPIELDLLNEAVKRCLLSR